MKNDGDTPAHVGHCTQSLTTFVNYMDAHYARAKSAGRAEGVLLIRSAHAVVIFAVETAVQAGISAVNTQQTLDQLATLPAMAAQVAQNPPALQSMITTQDGYAKASTVFAAATLPDFPQPPSSAETLSNGGMFYLPLTNAVTPLVNYLDASGNLVPMELRRGWFIGPETPQSTQSDLLGEISYIDWQGKARYAKRTGPYQFLVYTQNPDQTSVVYPTSAANNLSIGADPSQCDVYGATTLQMTDVNGRHFSVEVIDPPPITSANYVNFTPGVNTFFQITYTLVNDVPCSVARTGSLPAGVSYNPLSLTFSGSTTAQYAGVYNQTLTMTCGGSNAALSSSSNFSLVVANSTNLAFTSSPDIYGTYGIPVSFRVTTTGAPPAHLTTDRILNDYSLSLQDNGDGTATISGTPVPSYVAWGPSGQTLCPVVVTATNGIQTINQTLNLHFVPFPNPVSVITPANGSTLTFPVNVATSYPILTAGGIPGSVVIGHQPALNASPYALPSWLSSTTTATAPRRLRAHRRHRISARRRSALMRGVAPLESSNLVNLSVAYPQPAISLSAGYSMAFLAGTAGEGDLTSNVIFGAGNLTTTGPLPPGLSFTETPSPIHPCFTGNCPVGGSLTGTPPPGSGGDYKVPFTITGPGGTTMQGLRHRGLR